jgi:hypothetical protein
MSGPAVVQHKGGSAVFTSGTSGTASQTFTSSPSAGNCLVACISAESLIATPSISSVETGTSADNWAGAASWPATSEGIAAIYACPDTGASSSQINVTVSFGFTASASDSVIVFIDIFEVSGAASSGVVDQTSGNGDTTANTTTFTSDATGTTTQGSEIWFGMCAALAGSGTTIGLAGPTSGGWTNETVLTGTYSYFGTTLGAAQVSGYQVVNSAGEATYSGTMTDDSAYQAVVVTLKAAPPFTAPRPLIVTAQAVKRAAYW